jgi:acetolactate synthase regulatory subunit
MRVVRVAMSLNWRVKPNALLQVEKVIQHRKIVVKEVRTVTSTKKKKGSGVPYLV